MYFRACLEIGNYKKHERIMYIQAQNIIQAMEITRKVRQSKFNLIEPITREEYMKGVDLKYKN